MSYADNIGMRTTIRMNEELARRAKKLARERDRTFTEILEAAVADYLRAQSHLKPHKRIVLPVSGDPKNRVTWEQIKAELQKQDEQYMHRVFRGMSDDSD